MQTNSINVHVLNGIQTRQCRRFIFFVQGVPPVKDSFEFVFVTGDLWHLGNWQPHRAVKMSWQGGRFWRAEVDLPLSVHHFEYKYLIFNPNTGFVQWEQGPNRVWSLEVVPLNDIWEEQTASLANLSKIELAQTITTLKKLHLKEVEEMKSEHKKEIELRDAAYSALKNEYEMKIKEIENLKVEYECQLQSLTKRNEEYIQKLTNNYTIAQQSNKLFVANTSNELHKELVQVLNEHVCVLCLQRYSELDNNKSSCRYHVGVRLSDTQFSCCLENEMLSEGCRTGKHVPQFPEEATFVVEKFKKLMSLLTHSQNDMIPCLSNGSSPYQAEATKTSDFCSMNGDNCDCENSPKLATKSSSSSSIFDLSDINQNHNQ